MNIFIIISSYSYMRLYIIIKTSYSNYLHTWRNVIIPILILSVVIIMIIHIIISIIIAVNHINNRNNNRNNNMNIHNNNNRQNQNRNNNVPPRMQIVRIRSFNNNDNRQPHIRIRRNNNENAHRFLLINNLGINNHIRNRNLNNHNHLNFPEIVIDDVNKLDDANKSCTICLDEFKPNEKVTALPCLHYFHKNCIKKWLERKKDCPVCKFELTQENINQKMNNIFH